MDQWGPSTLNSYSMDWHRSHKLGENIFRRLNQGRIEYEFKVLGHITRDHMAGISINITWRDFFGSWFSAITLTLNHLGLVLYPS